MNYFLSCNESLPTYSLYDHVSRTYEQHTSTPMLTNNTARYYQPYDGPVKQYGRNMGGEPSNNVRPTLKPRLGSV